LRGHKKRKQAGPPARNLDNNVVEARFEARDRDPGDRVLDVRQGNAETQLGSNEGLGQQTTMTSLLEEGIIIIIIKQKDPYQGITCGF